MPSRAPLLVSLSLCLTLGSAACAPEDGSGDLRVIVEAEDTIVNGLDPGTSGESIADGWTVRFSAYVMTLGAVRIGQSDDPDAERIDATVRIFDLTAVDTGAELTLLPDVPAGRWDRIGYDTPAAEADTPCDASVEVVDCARMQSEGLTHLIVGTMEKPGGESCPPAQSCRSLESLDFEIAVAAPAAYRNCESDGVGGVAVPDGGEVVASATIHGDHIFFNGFPGGAEVVVRRAQWLANADTNLDDRVETTELEAIAQAQFDELFTNGTSIADLGSAYSFSGSPITPLDDAADYARAQLSTQGHLNGEGECAFSVLP